jgi:hypothetical protein
VALGLLIAYLTLSILSLLAIVLIVVALPARHFADHPTGAPGSRMGLRRAAVAALRNGVGLLLVATGLALSIPGVPGQGVLTILIGIMLMDFPGRRRAERRILAKPGVVTALNRIRRWFGRPPFVLDRAPAEKRGHPPSHQCTRGKGGRQ